VRDLNLRVEAGEVYGLLGRMAPARARRLKLFSALSRRRAGRTEIFGRDSNLVESREAVGFLPENPVLLQISHWRRGAAFFGKLCGLGGARLKNRVAELLEQVGLTNARDQRWGRIQKGCCNALDWRKR